MDERLRKVTLEFIQVVLETKPENYQEIKAELLQRDRQRRNIWKMYLISLTST